jgi:hypothetical protein
MIFNTKSVKLKIVELIYFWDGEGARVSEGTSNVVH